MSYLADSTATTFHSSDLVIQLTLEDAVEDVTDQLRSCRLSRARILGSHFPSQLTLQYTSGDDHTVDRSCSIEV